MLGRVIATDPSFAEWSARLRNEIELTRIVRRHLPRPIADRVRVSGAADGVLELAASAGAIAAAVRQRAPQLRASLARAGRDFTEIRVRVQVAGIGAIEKKPTPRQWDTADAAPLFELADRLPDGPLKAALAGWSRRARGRSPRML
jgi:hypothetical protein